MVPKNQQKEIIGLIKCARSHDYSGMRTHLSKIAELKTIARIKKADSEIQNKISK